MTDAIGQSHYALVEQVKQRHSGDTPAMSADWDGVLSDLIDGVSAELNRCVAKSRGCRGPWSFIADDAASERIYNANRGITSYLPIDDCTEITTVRLIGRDGSTQQTLTSPGDYWPARSGPIVGLWRVGGTWPQATIAAVGVTARWGYADNLTFDVTKQTITEVIREFLAAQASQADLVGQPPFGKVKISLGFSAKTNDLIGDYSYGGAHMRGG